MVDFHDRSTAAKISGNKFSVVAAMLGIIPVLAFSGLAITLVTFRMSYVLYDKLELNFTYKAEKLFVVSVMLGVSAIITGKILASIVKAVPIFGPLGGAISTSFMAGCIIIIYSRVFIYYSEVANKSA